MPERKNISVGPAGAWGSAFAKLASERGHRVRIYFRDPQDVKEFQKTHRTKRLPQEVLSRHIRATSDLTEFADGADLIALAIPTQELRPFFHKLRPSISSTTYVANLSKGLERETHLRMTEIMLEEDSTLIDRIVVMSGPGVAADVAQGAIASMVVASYNPPVAEEIRPWLASNRLVVYASKDPAGVEYGGALKNVMALGAGIADEMKASATSKSFYATRALEEMIALGTALGGQRETFIGVTGLGDLQLSCFGDSTRNFRAGQRLVRGLSVDEIQDIELAEGLYTLESAAELAKRYNIDASIIFGLYDVVYNGLDIREGIKQLMGRQPAKEHRGNHGLGFHLARLAMRAWHNFGISPLRNLR